MKAVPIHLPQAALPLLRNMLPDSYPVRPIHPSQKCLTQVKLVIPKSEWQGDWIVEEENDISWLADKLLSGVGDYMWVRETHRLHIKDSSVVCEYEDLEKRFVPVPTDRVRFDGRRMAPLCMLRMAARYVLKIHGIKVEWSDDKKTDLLWVIDVSRVGDFMDILKTE